MIGKSCIHIYLGFDSSPRRTVILRVKTTSQTFIKIHDFRSIICLIFFIYKGSEILVNQTLFCKLKLRMFGKGSPFSIYVRHFMVIYSMFSRKNISHGTNLTFFTVNKRPHT